MLRSLVFVNEGAQCDPDREPIMIEDLETTTTTVDMLQEGTQYAVCVAFVNEFGIGPLSAPQTEDVQGAGASSSSFPTGALAGGISAALFFVLLFVLLMHIYNKRRIRNLKASLAANYVLGMLTNIISLSLMCTQARKRMTSRSFLKI